MKNSAASAVVVTLHGVRCAGEVIEDIAVSRYAIAAERLERLLNMVAPESCCTVCEFIGQPAGDFRILTFDDGRTSDFTVVLPALLSRRLSGTFFVTANHVGQDGFTSLRQLRAMADSRMEIGSHGLTHCYLVTMPRRQAVREIQESKKKLEQMLGVEVASFAPVGGHYRKWMLDAAGEAGYRAFATMIPGRTAKTGAPLVLRRNHVQSRHGEVHIARLLSGRRGTLMVDRLRYCLLKQPKRWLGMRTYDRLRDLWLRALRGCASNSTAVQR